MARLLIKTAGLENRTLELRLGVNHVGRDPDCEFCIDHPTVSSLHCEISLTNDGVYIHDCDSTNGTFVNGEPVMETWLNPGQTVHLGDVELFVENTDAHMAIPQFERPRPKPPVVLPERRGVVPAPPAGARHLPLHLLPRGDVQRLRPHHAHQGPAAAVPLHAVQPQV